MSRFRECRERMGFSQKYVAMSIGVKPPQISKWEAGTQEPSRKNAIKLAQLYQVSIDYLLGQSDTPGTAVQASAQVGEVFVTTVPQIAMMGREMEKMTPEQRDQMLAVGKALFKEFFGKDGEDGST